MIFRKFTLKQIKSKKNKLFLLISSSIFACIFLTYSLTHSFYGTKSNQSTVIQQIVVTQKNEWTLNTGIIQYSSIIFIDENGDAIFEGLTFLNYPKESDILRNKNINCLLLADNQLTASETLQIIKIPLMNKDGTNVAIWKIKCKFTNLQFEESKVAIVDTNDFRGGENDSIFRNPLAVIPKNYIKFQTPTIYNAKNKKYQSVANCVHLVRGLKSIKMNRLLNWLELQFSIGYKHITFYFFEPNEDAKRAIEEIYPTDKVIIIDYHTDIKQVCKYEIQKLRNYPNSTLFKNLHDICVKSYAKHFSMSKGYTSNAHERMNTNDCYMHYKYEYEYVTNYDFDEFIFPRKYNMTSVPFRDATSLSKNYNIYDYAKRLFKKYGSTASSLLFDHVLFINIDNDFMNSLRKTMIANQNQSIIKLTDQPSRNMYFNVTGNDLKYVKYLLDLYQLYINLTKTSNLSRFDSLWNNIFATRVNTNNRNGKSIFNTQFTEGIHQHLTTVGVNGSKIARVSPNDGYSSHHRGSISSFFKEQYQSISYFYLDVEYYMFLSRLSK
jgi:hypothetical protein